MRDQRVNQSTVGALARAAAVLVAVSTAPARAEDAPAGQPDTQLGRLAASLKPGEMRELKTTGYTRDLLKSWYDWEWEGHEGRLSKYGAQKMFNVATSWSHDAKWDPKTRQVLFIGIGHYASMKFVTYSAKTNAWTLMPVPSWVDPRKPDGRYKGTWPRGHTYDRLAISPEHRLFAINWHGLYLYNIDSGVWTENPVASAGGKDAYQVTEYFPELEAIVYEASWGKDLRLWDVKTKKERRLGTHPFGIHGVMEYNPLHKVMVFGGGDSRDGAARTFYRMDAQGKIERLKPAPVHVNCRPSSKFLCDPVSGEYLAAEFRTGKVYAFHPIRDEWKEIAGLRFPDGLGVSVDTYGVLMFCTGNKVYVYKHKPVFDESSTPAPAESPDSRAARPRARANDPWHVVLWSGGTRIPSIDITPKGTLLAFAQRGGGDNHPNHVEMRRSTDGGKTWSKAKDFLEGSKERISCANPCPVIDRQTDDIWLFWAVRQIVGGKLKGKGVHYSHSSDDGLTWSEAKPFEIDGKPVHGLPSTCRGIQLSTGRLLLPFTVGGLPRTIYSDDHGETWRLGKQPASRDRWRGVGSSEHTLLELADGRVYMNHRASDTRLHRCRVICFSDDGGITWSDPVKAPDLLQPSNGCHSGLIRLTHPKTDDKSRTLFSSPWMGPDGRWGKNMGRHNLTIQISYDECTTWTPLKVIQTGNTSYSNIIVLPDKSIGCIYEFNDLRRRIWQRIMFCRLTLEWLTDGKDRIAARAARSDAGRGDEE